MIDPNSTADLFDEPGGDSDLHPAPLRSLVLSGSTPLTPDQKNFNRLIKQIEARRAQLADWGEAIPAFRQRYGRDLHPLLEQERALKAQLAEHLDWGYDQKGLTKTERHKLSALIIDLALDLLGQDGPDAAMKALYNKHSRSDFDAEESAQREQIKALLEDTLGVELGDDLDLSSPESLFEGLRAQFEAKQQARAERAKRRKPSAKQQAKEAQREADAKQVSQSIREVYRKLASALHPDRESDPEERQRKTALMQTANEAYERGALLELLELQLRLEHIDEAHLANLGGERLKHYIKILKDQVRELDSELQRTLQGLAAEFGFPPFGRLTPSGLMAQLRADVAATEVELRGLQKDLDAVGDVKSLKAWLKTVTLRRPPLSGFGPPF
jgi:uncharacterized protein YihD (DUF1040 family)